MIDAAGTKPRLRTGVLTIAGRGEREVVMIRWFDAAPEAVFDALTDPALVPLWMGPHGWTLPVCAIDARPGGAFRSVGRGASGGEIA